MASNKWLALGSVMCVFGGAATFLIPTTRLIPLEGPVAFSVGFLAGVTTGLGAAIALHNLISLRLHR